MKQAAWGRDMPKPKGRPKKPGGEGSPVRIETLIVNRARFVAAIRGTTLTEYLSGLLRPQVEKDFLRYAKELGPENQK